MALLGFRYESIGSIILFFMITGAIGVLLEMFVKALPNALLSLDRISVKIAKVLFVILDTLTTIIVMTIVDDFMDSVSATTISILVIAILMALYGMSDIKEKQ